jgi:prolyl-tRNA editing enzyme YbaK/EbsC (Cys-tRNA(Pro) deacylase)
MKGALDVHRELLARGIPHEILRLPHTVATAAEIPDVLGLPPEVCVAVRVYATSQSPSEAAAAGASAPSLVGVITPVRVLPDCVRLLRALGGSRTLRSARSDVISAATDFSAALVSPVGLPPGFEVYADAALLEPGGSGNVRYAPTGDGGTVLGIRVEDLLAASGAPVVALSLGDGALSSVRAPLSAHGV